MNQELLIAASLGLIGGLIPGPVLAAMFTMILQDGIRKSLRMVWIAFITESLVALCSLLLLASLGLNEAFFRGLSLLGALILLWIASSIWKVRSLEQEHKVQFGFWKVILMILSNGVLWTYWLTICIPKAILLGEEIRGGAYLFMGLVQLGWLLSTLSVGFLFSRFRQLLAHPRLVPVLFKLFALAFVYFALDMGIKSIRFFFT